MYDSEHLSEHSINTLGMVLYKSTSHKLSVRNPDLKRFENGSETLGLIQWNGLLNSGKFFPYPLLLHRNKSSKNILWSPMSVLTH